MFDLVQKHKRFAQIILFMMMVPFAFFGVDYYFRGGTSDADVASVSGKGISQTEFTESMREQQDQMRRQLGRNFDPAMFDSPEVRFALLEQLINQRLITNKAQAEHFRVSDVQLQQIIVRFATGIVASIATIAINGVATRVKTPLVRFWSRALHDLKFCKFCNRYLKNHPAPMLTLCTAHLVSRC